MKSPKPYQIYILVAFISIFIASNAQEEIQYSFDENSKQYQFNSVDSPLTPIAGAPEPFYTYWWEFGDGHYSTEKNPKHAFANKNNYNIILARTNNYDDGPSRPIRKSKLYAEPNILASTNSEFHYLEKHESLKIEKNQNPKPNEEIVFVQTYKNTSSKAQNGTLLFFYNESTFENSHFDLMAYRNHYQEQIVSYTKSEFLKKIDEIEQQQTGFSITNQEDVLYRALNKIGSIEYSTHLLAKDKENETKSFANAKNLKKEINLAFANYSNVLAFNFEDLQSEEERNLFMSFKTTNTMLEDTNISISVQSILIPNDINYASSVKHLMPIVTAHDPNKLIVSKSKTYRTFVKKKALEYEIKFQNVGKGPAEEVKLRFYNNADIDIEAIELIDFEPKCAICSENCEGSFIDTTITAEYIEFFFHNIYLPGTRQSDIESREKSKGFVKFALKTKKKIKQNNLSCRTEIYFDKENPIRTNNAKTLFQKRIYFGLEAGGNYHPVDFPRADMFIRGTFTLRILKNWYYRAAISPQYIPSYEIENFSTTDTMYQTKSFGYDVIDSAGTRHYSEVEDSIRIAYYHKTVNSNVVIKQQSVKLNIIPVQIQREINRYLSIGVGLHSVFNLQSFQQIKTTVQEQNFDLEAESIVALEHSGSANMLYEVDTFYLENIRNTFVDETEAKTSTQSQSSSYQLDFVTGLFLDLNIGRINSLPYFGIRANFDYHFNLKKLNPSFQFYLGANF